MFKYLFIDLQAEWLNTFLASYPKHTHTDQRMRCKHIKVSPLLFAFIMKSGQIINPLLLLCTVLKRSNAFVSVKTFTLSVLEKKYTVSMLFSKTSCKNIIKTVPFNSVSVIIVYFLALFVFSSTHIRL